MEMASVTLRPDDDNDGVLDENDRFPRDRVEQYDTDGDSAGNAADDDDDNDGVLIRMTFHWMPMSFSIRIPMELAITDSDDDGDGIMGPGWIPLLSW